MTKNESDDRLDITLSDATSDVLRDSAAIVRILERYAQGIATSPNVLENQMIAQELELLAELLDSKTRVLSEAHGRWEARRMERAKNPGVIVS